ncbi:MAG TPA: hypothetical protein DEH11_09045 [Actinobacteria bacterium]|nr:hypothetical protein [Actinomycetota bacterium]
MRSTVTARPAARARRASESRGAHVLARAGLTAQGVIYILIGWVAILVALGKSSHQADQQGALQLLPFGVFLLLLAAVGLLIFGVYGHLRRLRPVLGALAEGITRLRDQPAAVSHHRAFRFVTGAETSSGSGWCRRAR